MRYDHSVHGIDLAEVEYYRLCQLAEVDNFIDFDYYSRLCDLADLDDDIAAAQYHHLCKILGHHADTIGEALATLHRLRAAHKERFGSLPSVGWIWL